MSKVPSIDYYKLISALRRDGWVVVSYILKQASVEQLNELL